MSESAGENLEWIRVQVAEKVGWRSIEYSRDGCLVGYAPGRRVFQSVPSYALDIRAASELIDFLTAYGLCLRIHIAPDPRGEWRTSVEIELRSKTLSRSAAARLPLAVCQAFLSLRPDQIACDLLTPAKAIPAKIPAKRKCSIV